MNAMAVEMTIYGYLVMGYLLGFLLFLLLLWNWYESRNSSSLRKWPLLGMSPVMLCNAHRIHDYITDCLRQFPTFEFRGPLFLDNDFLVTADPANVNYMLNKHFPNFQKGPKVKLFYEEFTGEGIFSSEKESWSVLRRSTHALFNDARFQRLFESTIQNQLEKRLIPILHRASAAGKEVDLQDLFSRFTFDNICTFVLGADPGTLSFELRQEPHLKAFEEAEEVVLYRHFLPEIYWRLQRWLGVGKEGHVREKSKSVNRFVFQSISSKRESLKKMEEEEEDQGFDYLTAYLKYQDGEWSKGIELSDKFLRDAAINLLAAGKSTVGVALSWFFWVIATNPEVENKIWEEIKASIKDFKNDHEPPNKNWWISNAEQLRSKKQLIYLHAALCETLRLFPPVPFQIKCPVQDDILPSGHRIRADSIVLFSVYGMGRMESIWGADCLEFKPERWIDSEGGIVNVPAYKFAAFNAGPRTCLGKDMTLIQMKMVAVAIISNFHIQLVEGHPVSPCTSIILHMKHGLKVKATKRDF